MRETFRQQTVAAVMQVFQARLGAATRWQRWLSRLGLLAPRDVVLQQAWQLRDEHGVVLLSFHSVEHKAAPPPPRRRSWTDVFTQWLQPVRAQVCAAPQPGLPWLSWRSMHASHACMRGVDGLLVQQPLSDADPRPQCTVGASI